MAEIPLKVSRVQLKTCMLRDLKLDVSLCIVRGTPLAVCLQDPFQFLLGCDHVPVLMQLQSFSGGLGSQQYDGLP